MALSIKPAKNSTQPDGCTELYINDSTGAYNATTNTGGYGTPNPAYTDIASITLRIFRPNVTDTYEDIILNGGSTPTAVQYANPNGGYYVALNSINTGQSTGSETLSDGVYTIQEFVCYDRLDPATEVSVTNGSKDVVISTGYTDYTDFNYMYLPDGKLYEVASINALTGEVTLVENYAGTTTSSTNFTYAFMGVGYAMDYCSANTCMTSLLADQFVKDVQNGCCSEEVSQKAEHAFYEFYILKSNEAENNFAAFATNIQVYNEKYCSGSTGGCGCGCS